MLNQETLTSHWLIWDMHKPKPKLAIFASGRGSNAKALMNAIERGFLPAQLTLVLSNKPNAPVIELAREQGYPTRCIPSDTISREEHEDLILEAVRQAEVNHILLAGYMRILTPNFLKQFQKQGGGHILNIHPSLLPDFPGLHAIERQHASKRPIAGATVHHVTNQVDAGPIVLQGSLEVRGDESIDELGQRIREEVEHSLYPRAVRLFLDRLANPQHQEVLL